MSCYWDTSCLLKLYCREPDSETYLDLVDQHEEPLVVSSLSVTELFYALLQKESRSELGKQRATGIFAEVEEDIQSGYLRVYPLGDSIYSRAREVAELCYGSKLSIFLRSLDGIHLATALQSNSDTVVTTDERMMSASKILGLKVL